MDCIVTGSVLNLFWLFSFNDIPFSTKKRKDTNSQEASDLGPNGFFTCI